MKKRQGKIKEFKEKSQELLNNTDKTLSLSVQNFFEILDILESIPNFEKHLNLIKTITNLLEKKLSILADEKRIALDSCGQTILHRLVKKNYPLILLNTLLSQPVAKHIVLFHESKYSLLTELQQYGSQDKLAPKQDPLIYYLSFTGQPWLSLMKKCNSYLTFRYRSPFSSPDLLKTLLIRFGDFPWNAAPDGRLNPALFGYHLLAFFLCHCPAPLEDIQDFIKHQAHDFFEKIRTNWLELFPPVKIFETIFINFLVKDHNDDIFTRIDFVLSRKIDSELTKDEFINFIVDNCYRLDSVRLIKIVKNILPYVDSTRTLLYQLADINCKTEGQLEDLFYPMKERKEILTNPLKKGVEKIFIELEIYCQNPSFFSTQEAEEKEKFIFLLISFQAPIDHLQQFYLNCAIEEKAYIEQTIKTISPSLINRENSAYLAEIFALFPPPYSYEVMEKLNKKHVSASDPPFADNLSAAIITILSQEQAPPAEELISAPEIYHYARSQALDYLQKVGSLVCKRIDDLPASSLIIITDYLSPENLIDLLLKNPCSTGFYTLKAYDLLNKIPVITYIAFTGAMLVKTDTEQQLTHWNYEEKASAREGKDIISDIVLSIEENKKKSLAALFKAIVDFNEIDPTVILTVVPGKEEKIVIIDSNFPDFHLKFLANLIKLTQRYAQDKPIAYPFVINLNLKIFATLIVVCAKGIGQCFLATKNITPFFHLVKEYIQKLLINGISDLEDEFRFFTQKNPLSSFYKEEKLEITPRLEASIDCWEALSKHEKLHHLIDLSGLKKIEHELAQSNLKKRLQKMILNLTDSTKLHQNRTVSPHITLFHSSLSYPAPVYRSVRKISSHP